jgi:hypothetical protein
MTVIEGPNIGPGPRNKAGDRQEVLPKWKKSFSSGFGATLLAPNDSWGLQPKKARLRIGVSFGTEVLLCETLRNSVLKI